MFICTNNSGKNTFLCEKVQKHDFSSSYVQSNRWVISFFPVNQGHKIL